MAEQSSKHKCLQFKINANEDGKKKGGIQTLLNLCIHHIKFEISTLCDTQAAFKKEIELSIFIDCKEMG